MYGPIVDQETRCIHYQTKKDIMAIKFKCCKKYYPCYKCHEESEDHHIVVWSKEENGEKVILCGVCRTEHTIREYVSMMHCSVCQSELNERCETHYHLYFEL